jgi:hypothetical protein
MRVFFRIVAVRQDVRQRVAADIAAGLGDQQQHRDIGDQPADRIHEAVIAIQRDQPGDAEERGRRQIITGDRPAVLQPRHAAARGIEIRRRAHALGRQIGDVHRDRDDHREHREGQPAVAYRSTPACASAGVAMSGTAASSADNRPFSCCRMSYAGPLRFAAELGREFPQPSGRSPGSPCVNRSAQWSRRPRTR